MKAKRVNEANSYLTSPIFPRFISRKRVQQEQALQHADFLEGHAVWVPIFHGPWVPWTY